MVTLSQRLEQTVLHTVRILTSLRWLLLYLKVDAFLEALINYDKENIHESCLKAIDPFLINPEFDPDFIRSKSAAAAGLCAWAINIVTWVNCQVQ